MDAARACATSGCASASSSPARTRSPTSPASASATSRRARRARAAGARRRAHGRHRARPAAGSRSPAGMAVAVLNGAGELTGSLQIARVGAARDARVPDRDDGRGPRLRRRGGRRHGGRPRRRRRRRRDPGRGRVRRQLAQRPARLRRRGADVARALRRGGRRSSRARSAPGPAWSASAGRAASGARAASSGRARRSARSCWPTSARSRDLRVDGVPVGRSLPHAVLRARRPGGQLHRRARHRRRRFRPRSSSASPGARASGLARTGSVAHHGSGEIFLASDPLDGRRLPREIDDLFAAAVDATEEAVLNTLWSAERVAGARAAPSRRSRTSRCSSCSAPTAASESAAGFARSRRTNRRVGRPSRVQSHRSHAGAGPAGSDTGGALACGQGARRWARRPVARAGRMASLASALAWAGVRAAGHRSPLAPVVANSSPRGRGLGRSRPRHRARLSTVRALSLRSSRAFRRSRERACCPSEDMARKSSTQRTGAGPPSPRCAFATTGAHRRAVPGGADPSPNARPRDQPPRDLQLGAQLDDLVEGQAVGARDPLVGRAALGVDRARRVAEADDGRDLLVVGLAEELGQRVGIGDAVGA